MSNINIKDSPHEWDQQPPELLQNADFVASPPQTSKIKDTSPSKTSDLTMDFMMDHEQRHQIRNILITGFEKIGDYVVSFFVFILLLDISII